jgi:hypothetical protein
MITKRTSSWKLRDWFFLFLILAFGIPLLIAIVHGVAPNSGFSTALHAGGHTISNLLLWIANAFTMLANWFQQL